jgi:TonB family protein
MSMARRLLTIAMTLLLLMPSASSAQAPVTNTITTQSTVATPPPGQHLPGITAPASFGVAHSCPIETYYPPIAIRLNMEGNVTIGFTISAEGVPTNPAVVASSGFKPLDDAALTCVATWVYKPAMQNGQPIAVPWRVVVRWALTQPPVPTGPPHLCQLRDSTNMTGSIVSLLFDVGMDGTVRDVVANPASGNDQIEKLAVDCATQWRYQPYSPPDQHIGYVWSETVRIPFDPANPLTAKEVLRAPHVFDPKGACRLPYNITKPSTDTVVLVDLRSVRVVPSGALPIDFPIMKPTNMRVWQSSGSKDADDFAVSCVPSLTITPAFRYNQPTEVTIPIRINWSAS